MKAKRAWIWIGLGIAAVALHNLLGKDSAAAEKFFSRGLFAGWRWIWDTTMGLSPLPWLYVCVVALLVLGAARLYSGSSHPRPKRPKSFIKTFGRIILGIAAWAGGLVFFFYVLWGFNYNRVGLEKQLGLDVSPLRGDELRAEAHWASRMSAESRAAIPGAADEALGKDMIPENMESELRTAMTSVLRQAGYPAPGRVRVRTFVPGGWMMRFSGTGVYLPYFSEAYTAANLLPFEKPFTQAHEMAHGYGITDEGGANFLAFLACSASRVPVLRYSGYAAYWGYAAGEMRGSELKELWAALPEGMKADLTAAQRNAARYRGALEKISRKVYATYLKSQGIDEGLRSYSRFVGLVAAWAKKTPSFR